MYFQKVITVQRQNDPIVEIKSVSLFEKLIQSHIYLKEVINLYPIKLQENMGECYEIQD